ncbi:hypothetical protein ACQZV8_20750 [Magnetococcales bacterium HHB-1]
MMLSKVIPLILKDLRFLKSVINVEHKFVDKDLAGAVSSTTGSITPLSNLAQGDDYNARNGRSIKLSSLHVRGTVNANASATTTKVRLIIFNDRVSNGSTPAITDVLASSDPMSFLNLNNTSRFKIIYDRLYRLTDDQDNSVKTFRCNKKLGWHAKYNGSAGNVNEMQTGHLWFLILSDQATNTPSVDIHTRLRFVDN